MSVPTLILDTNVVVSALRSSLGASHRFIDYLCRVGNRSVVHFQVRPNLTDPDDEMILEAAIASGSEWIVTYNVRDLATGSARYGVEVLTPADALQRMGVAR